MSHSSSPATLDDAPRVNALLACKPGMWREWKDADFHQLELLARHLERELARAKRDCEARAREACTYEGRTGCSFARSLPQRDDRTQAQIDADLKKYHERYGYGQQIGAPMQPPVAAQCTGPFSDARVCPVHAPDLQAQRSETATPQSHRRHDDPPGVLRTHGRAVPSAIATPAWIEFNGRTGLPPVDVPVLAWWEFGDGGASKAMTREAPVAVATFNGHLWHNPDDDEDDYRDPAFWMPLPEVPHG